MGKDHLKMLVTPKTWPVRRKGRKYITRPYPGAHAFFLSLSVGTILKDVLGLAKTKKEVNYLLINKNLMVDGKRVRDRKHLVGIMDTLTLLETEKYYRMMLKKGKLNLIEIKKEEANKKICQIKGKSLIPKHKKDKTKAKSDQIQLNLHDGRNILVQKGDYKVGDSLVLEVPAQKILEHLKLEKGLLSIFVGGKHLGEKGKVEEIHRAEIVVKTEEGKSIRTKKEYAMIVGKEKPLLTI